MFSKVFIISHFASLALAVFLINPNDNTNKCLDVRRDVIADGSPVDIWDCDGSGAQVWLINEGPTTVRLANTNFCLDAGTIPGNGGKMRIWTCIDGLPSQSWIYSRVKTIALAAQGNQCLDLPGGELTNGNKVDTKNCDPNDPSQLWTATFLQPLIGHNVPKLMSQ